MNTRRELGGSWRATRLVATLCFVTLAGCENFRGFEGDPLTGGPPMPRGPINNGNTQAAANGGVAPTGPQPPLPSLPAPSTSTSPAALTGGGASPSLDPNRDLRIGAGLGGATVPPATGPGPAVNSGATLQQPQPVNDGGQTAAPRYVNPNITLASTGRLDTYEQLQDALGARGVTWQRLEMVTDNGEWKFCCSIPDRQKPGFRHSYENRNKTDLSAIRAVIDQIDREQARP